jgi:hypothetical protein
MLSKDWQLKNARGVLRILANEISSQKIQDETLNDFIHLAICDFAEALSSVSAPDYGDKEELVLTTDVADLTNLRIDNIVKVVDGTNGLVIRTGAEEFEGLKGIPQKSKSVCCSRHGESLLFFKGSSVTAYGTITLYYNRIPKRAVQDTDYLDVRDKYVKLVLDKAKVLLYEQLKQAPPEFLTNQINNNIAAIRETTMRELGTAENQPK